MNQFLFIAQILFSLTCLAAALGCWIVIANAGKIKKAIDEMDKELIQAKEDIYSLEEQLNSFANKLSPQEIAKEILLNPKTILVLIDLVALFTTKRFTATSLIKAILK
ncbi:MAG: hypothetical protein ACK481_08080 [Candidatus Melainabacteria bacterium]|jgi:hypothetical protein